VTAASIAEEERFPRAAPNPILVTVVLLGGALVAWLVTFERMEGMDAGPGTHLGGFGWYVGIWITMMAAMMLPSVAPMVLAFSRISQERSRQGRSHVPTSIFVGGYFLAWAGYGIAAYGIFRAITATDSGFLAWDRGGPWVAGAAVAAAGVYQLTPLKRVCLLHCRTPLHFVLHGWKDGWSGALKMGFAHGGYCVGCCWGLMLILFALGVMSLFWMVVVAAIIFAEKVTPFGARLSRVLAVTFVLFGIWVAVAPGSVPGLTQPDQDSPGMMQMEGMSP
jgi:predicted metal-binding membrane protein